MERKVCTYCGKEGHHAANCPWRPSRLVLALVAALAVAGCGQRVEQNQGWPDREGTKHLGVGFLAVEFRLQDGTQCVATTAGGVSCDWGVR